MLSTPEVKIAINGINRFGHESVRVQAKRTIPSNIGDWIMIARQKKPNVWIAIKEIHIEIQQHYPRYKGRDGYVQLVKDLQQLPCAYFNAREEPTAVFLLISTKQLCLDQKKCRRTHCLLMHYHHFSIIDAHKPVVGIIPNRWRIIKQSSEDIIAAAVIRSQGGHIVPGQRIAIELLMKFYYDEYLKPINQDLSYPTHRLQQFDVILKKLCRDLLSVQYDQLGCASAVITKVTRQEFIAKICTKNASLEKASCPLHMSPPLGAACQQYHINFSLVHTPEKCRNNKHPCVHVESSECTISKYHLEQQNYYNVDYDVKSRTEQQILQNELSKVSDQIVMRNPLKFKQTPINSLSGLQYITLENQSLEDLISLSRETSQTETLSVEVNGYVRSHIFEVEVIPHLRFYQHFHRSQYLQKRDVEFPIDGVRDIKINIEHRYDDKYYICIMNTRHQTPPSHVRSSLMHLLDTICRDTVKIVTQLHDWLHAPHQTDLYQARICGPYHDLKAYLTADNRHKVQTFPTTQRAPAKLFLCETPIIQLFMDRIDKSMSDFSNNAAEEKHQQEYSASMARQVTPPPVTSKAITKQASAPKAKANDYYHHNQQYHQKYDQQHQYNDLQHHRENALRIRYNNHNLPQQREHKRQAHYNKYNSHNDGISRTDDHKCNDENTNPPHRGYNNQLNGSYRHNRNRMPPPATTNIYGTDHQYNGYKDAAGYNNQSNGSYRDNRNGMPPPAATNIYESDPQYNGYKDAAGAMRRERGKDYGSKPPKSPRYNPACKQRKDFANVNNICGVNVIDTDNGSSSRAAAHNKRRDASYNQTEHVNVIDTNDGFSSSDLPLTEARTHVNTVNATPSELDKKYENIVQTSSEYQWNQSKTD